MKTFFILHLSAHVKLFDLANKKKISNQSIYTTFYFFKTINDFNGKSTPYSLNRGLKLSFSKDTIYQF